MRLKKGKQMPFVAAYDSAVLFRYTLLAISLSPSLARQMPLYRAVFAPNWALIHPSHLGALWAASPRSADRFKEQFNIHSWTACPGCPLLSVDDSGDSIIFRPRDRALCQRHNHRLASHSLWISVGYFWLLGFSWVLRYAKLWECLA